MKNLCILFLFLFLGNYSFAQKYLTKTGNIHFEASVPLFEDVNAQSKTAIVVLNADSGDLASIVTVRSFKFKVALMEEHFNENYAESAKYPKMTFTGKIANFKKVNLTAEAQNYTISGTLNFHGVNQTMNSVASIYTKDGKVFISGKFITKPADFNVEIPKMVTKKIAENVNVDYHFELLRQ